MDDNNDAADILSMLLRELGHTVIVENDSLRALERSRIEVPDVCLLDIGLPGMDGNELARRIRSQPETRNCMLIAITGYGKNDDRKNSSDAGFDHHFVKPVDINALINVLQNSTIIQAH